jgi:hypothetical protein
MKSLTKVSFVFVLTLMIFAISNCKEAENNLPRTKPIIMKFYFTEKEISISRGTSTRLIIEVHHTSQVLLNGEELNMGGTSTIKALSFYLYPSDFNNKPGKYRFKLEAFHSNGETTTFHHLPDRSSINNTGKRTDNGSESPTMTGYLIEI